MSGCHADSSAEQSPLRVLAIDDNPCDVELLRYAFETCGSGAVHIEPLGNGAEALALLSGSGPFSYDLVLIDWRLPGVPGDTVARGFLSRPDRTGGVPIVVFSSALPTTLAGELRELGAEIREKPIDLDGYTRLALELLSCTAVSQSI